MILPLYTVVLIVPTGIGASIGGYAGDALPVARAMAQVADRLITHPNVLNGAQLYWPIQHTLYVEGYGLDQFAAGVWGLRPVRRNRIGVIFDRGIESELQLRHRQVVDAAEATLGLSVIDPVYTDQALEVELEQAGSSASWGRIRNPDSLLRAADRAIDAGAEALAVVARFPDDDDEQAQDRTQQYVQGNGVDPIGGVEAIVSHLVVRQFRIPCAHAPALSVGDLDPKVHPRAAAEELGYTFLPCVLVGLSQAPRFILPQDHARSGDLWADQVDAVVVPATACGGSAILSLNAGGVLTVAVRQNQTRMQASPQDLGIQAIQVESYWEALGILVCDRAGVNPYALLG